jgi:hypothetical protein
MWGHLGWQYGYTSSMLYLPKRSASIVVLINDNNMLLINLAAIALCIVVEYHLETTGFLLISVSVLLLASMFVLWPLSYAAQSLRKLRKDSVAPPRARSRGARAARWIALLTGVSIAAATVLYLAYSRNPSTLLSWSGGNPTVRWFIGLSIVSAVLALSLVILTFHVWRARLWSFIWRLHYTLVTLAGLIAAFSLLRLLF